MFSCLVNPVDQFALMIGLPKRRPQSNPGTRLAAALLDLGERGVAVDMRLARPEQIQVGTVQNMDGVQCHLQSLGKLPTNARLAARAPCDRRARTEGE